MRRSANASLLLFGLVALVASGCGRSGVPGLGGPGPTPTGSSTATPIPTPPVDPDVRFTSISASATSLRPGQFGVSMTAVLLNAGTTPIDEVFATLTFTDGSGSRSTEIDHREADLREGAAFGPPPARSMIAGTSMTLTFNADVMPWAQTSDFQVNATATFVRGNDLFTATPAVTPLNIAIPDVTEHLVTETVDEDDGGGADDVSLREALLAAQTSGVHRIRFDPAAFAASAPGRITIADGLGALPAISQTVILDGHDAGVEIFADDSNSNDRRFGLHLRGPGITVSEIHFTHPSVFFPIETLSGNCGQNAPTGGDGEAIRVDGSAQDVVLFRNVFYDGPTIFERSCYPALVRFFAGSGHRVIGNDFYDIAMDAMYVSNAAASEISGNRVAAAAGNLTIADEGVYVADLNGALFVVGNLFVDQEFAGVVSGAGPETMFLLHNTIVRSGGNAVNRQGGTPRPLFLRNNLFIANDPDNINGNASTLDYGYELIFDANDGYCTAGCTAGNGNLAVDPQVAIVGSNSWAALTPLTGSPAIDSGEDLIDRNGSAPGRFHGTGPDRGAVETGPD